MFKKLTITFVASLLLLAACATPTPVALPPTATSKPTEVPKPTEAPRPTEAPKPTETPKAEGQSAVFVIDSAKTIASYTVEETLFNENNRINTAVGQTSKIEGQLTLNYSDPTKSSFGTFTVDISTLKSDSNQRDNFIRNNFLESTKFPLVTFVVKKVENLPTSPKEGQAQAFALVGDMKVKQTTKEVKWEVNAVLNGNLLTGKARTFILMKDFNFDPPNILGRLAVKDGVTVVLDFTFVKK